MYPSNYTTGDDAEYGDSETNWESDGTGGEVEVTRRSDGSSTVHWGGPCGSTNYNEYGEEA